MTHISRTVAALTLVSLLAPGFNRLARSQTPTAPEVSRKTVTISGSAGLAGVMMKGLPGRVVTKSDGSYACEVPHDWSGTVTPEKEGYTFEPPTRTYDALSENLTDENYAAKLLTFVISGNVGLPGVEMRGLPNGPISDTNGSYRVAVPYAWTGKVAPVKAGYAFEPPMRVYSRVTGDCKDDNYAAGIRTFEISGNVGLAGVAMKGLPGQWTPITDMNGIYSTSVEYGWAGKVVPSKEGYEFEPPSRDYAPVMEEQKNQDYKASVINCTISDRIALHFEEGKPDEPIQGVLITTEPGGLSAVTDLDGRYSIGVPYGWTGKLTITKSGFEFDPPSVPYNSPVKSDIIDGKPMPAGTAAAMHRSGARASLPRASGAESGGSVLIVPTKAVSPVEFTQIAEDMRVMLNILREKLSEPRTIRGVLYDYGDFFADAGRATEALYLQGYAAVFMLKTDFPLSVPPAPGQAVNPKAQAGDPVWQRARDRLYAPQNVGPYGPAGLPREADQKSLDQLKADLVQTLQHAANIRNIDPNEWIILTVTERSGASPIGGFGGGMSGMGMMGGMSYGGATGSSGGGYGVGGSVGGVASYGGASLSPSGDGGLRWERRAGAARGRSASQAPASPAPATVLTIQAKKADINAFAEGKLSFELFQQRVKVFTY